MTPPHGAPSALVVTVVHHPDDARIRFREMAALRRAGWRVTYAAPFTGYGLEVPPDESLQRYRDLPRARGRRRLRALLRARRLICRLAPHHDVVLIHDPELLLAVAGLRSTVVWDVHEDTAAAVVAKQWLPRPVRVGTAAVIRRVEGWAERRMPLLLAEHAYQERFRRQHAVVPNAVSVPPAVAPPGRDRVVYLGSITVERGAEEVVELARLLTERTHGEVVTHVVGTAHGPAAALVRRAHEDGVLQWHGFVANDTALTMLDGALAGLSLLRDLPNYRHSMPTKILEYMAHGVPVVSTPLPIARELVDASGTGLIVPFEDPQAAADAVLRLRDDTALAARSGAAGHRAATASYDWTALSEDFVTAMAGAAGRSGPSTAH